jgi:AraC-like DNA-binding protein
LIEGSRFSVGRGDVFVIPPKTVHAYFDTAGLEVYHVLFKKSFIEKNRSEAESADGFLRLMEIEPFLRQSYSEAMFLHLAPAELSAVMNDFSYLEEGGKFDSDGDLPLRNHTAWKVIYYLSHLLSKQIKSGKSNENKKYRRQIFDALEYLHQRYSEKITVELLAEAVFLSRSTFLRSFREICGCSPTEYLNRYRVKRALELLAASDRSKTEIAHSVGFYDLSHMERAIKNSK